ncbi:MAG: GntR family transcriptional regulator [Halioglobus sp.]
MVHSKVKTDPIYDTIKEGIMSGRLVPGEQLKQDDIARRYGVSKIPVREALARLEVDGFVLFRKNRGATVREMTADELLQLMDIRIALECKALETAVPHMVASDISGAKQILKECASKTELEDWSDLNVRFHQQLYEPCGNRQLVQMISDLRQRMGPHIRLLVTEASGLTRPQDEHHDILNACETGDVDTAVKLLCAHIETTKKETAAKLRKMS